MVFFQAFWRAWLSYEATLALRSPIRAWLVMRSDWPGRWWLFDGAAVSAFFVVIIVALTVLLALRYMLLTRRSLCHPRSSFGRGLMVATGLFAALHFINVGTHVRRSRSGTCSPEGALPLLRFARALLTGILHLLRHRCRLFSTQSCFAAYCLKQPCVTCAICYPCKTLAKDTA